MASDEPSTNLHSRSVGCKHRQAVLRDDSQADGGAFSRLDETAHPRLRRSLSNTAAEITSVKVCTGGSNKQAMRARRSCCCAVLLLDLYTCSRHSHVLLNDKELKAC